MPNSSNNDLTYAVQSTPLSVLGKLTVTAWFCQLWLQFRSPSILKMCLYTGQLWLRPTQVTLCRQLSCGRQQGYYNLVGDAEICFR